MSALSSLPIDEVRGDVESALDDAQTLVVVAPTGSGKSTRLPIWIADRSSGPVYVVQPRRVACRSLANYVAELVGEPVGRRVGYQVRFEDRTGPDTRISFVTPGIALRILVSGGIEDAAGAATVVVDEFHERGCDTDLIVAIVRARQRAGASVRLVVASATLDAEATARALDGAAVVRSEGRAFPVDVTYAGGPTTPSREDLDVRVTRAVEAVLSEDAKAAGEILVFLPGKGEIRACEDALQPVARAYGRELAPVHASLPAKRLRAAFSSSKQLRIFLATNVAETSVTLPGVRTVIDSGLARVRAHRAGRAALVLEPIAEDSMEQRRGRAGRVAAGRCIRLWSARYRPTERTAPEVERIELDDFVLDAAHAGLEGRDFDQAPWVTTPPDFAVQRARDRLHAWGALDDEGRLTERGERLAQAPVSAYEARLLLDPPTELAPSLVLLVALTQSRRELLLSIDKLSGSQRQAVEVARDTLWEQTGDEVRFLLGVLSAPDPGAYGVDRRATREVRRIADQLAALVGTRPPNAKTIAEPDRLATAILERWPEAGFVRRKRAERGRRRSRMEPWANGELELLVDPAWTPSGVASRPGWKPPAAGVLLEHEWIGGRGVSVRGVGRKLLPCNSDVLLATGRAERSLARIHVKRPGGVPRLTAEMVVRYAGVELDALEVELRGTDLHRAAAGAILEGRLLPGAGDRLRDDRHLLQIAATVGAGEPALQQILGEELASDPLEDRVAARLDELGVERSSDLALVELEDLRARPLREAGPIAWEALTRIEESFPRRWIYQGRAYRCDVSPTARLVRLRPDNARARKEEPPPRHVLPRFDGFRVEFQKASRIVRLR